MKILVTRQVPHQSLESIDSDHDVVVSTSTGAMSAAEFGEEVISADAVLSFLTDPLSAEVIDGATRLRVISQMSAGVDNIDIAACTIRGIPVGHTPGVLTEVSADSAFALLAASVRRIPEGRDLARNGAWTEWRHDLLLGGDLHGTTLGIVGVGAIGQAIARRATGFNMRVLYTSRTRRPHVESSMRLSYRILDDLLAESDHIVLAVPLTPDTHHLIDSRALGLMKPTATLVNIARGSVVDTEALVDALASGRLGGAALDVTDPEPLPAGHPLLSLENCLVVPHIASASISARSAMLRLAVANLVAGVEGLPMPHCVNPEVYEVRRNPAG